MDRNTVIGLVLIFLILIGFNHLMTTDKEELEKRKHELDSLAQVEEDKQELDEEDQPKTVVADSLGTDSLQTDTSGLAMKDSVQVDSTGKPIAPVGPSKEELREKKLHEQYLDFAAAAEGTDSLLTIENSHLLLSISSKGGHIARAELKGYKAWDGDPLILLEPEHSSLDLTIPYQARVIHTKDLYFKPIRKKENGEDLLIMRLEAGENRHIDYVYALGENDRTVGFSIRLKNMESILGDMPFLDMTWKAGLRRQEKAQDYERDNSTIYYKYYQDDVDYLTETNEKQEESIKTPVKWIGFKQQFFSMVLIADEQFESAELESIANEKEPTILKDMTAVVPLDYNRQSEISYEMHIYFGPNQYQMLKKYELGMEGLIPLGWGIFRWINVYFVIPLFNLLDNWIVSYGVIILLITIIIKLILFPLTYRSYVSSAKMRVLKPEIDEINKKIPKEKAMERQQATMNLYKRAGVNPLGGCLPMLLQMPILLAMFRFFPASVELRQKSFLWADDLSTYDNILDLPFSIPWYGDHVSLFTLLMTISTIIYTRMNSNQMSGQSQMPGMKVMMYMMPVMFLFWFNSYASALSYYYFLANIITFGQMFVIKRYFIDEEALFKKLQENKKKPRKKSGWQERMEKMARERAQQQTKKRKRR
jgi:YidC/Oxa1 family membrane protein insertase